MSLQITKLSLDDYDDCLDFLNLVFSQSGHPIDFEKELPKAFRREEHLMERHWACRRDGRIRAILGVYPMDLLVGGQCIHCATVGNVATHTAERGNGLMKILMQEAMGELDANHIDLSRLGGQRLRYNRYGYEQAGSRCRVVLTRKNVLERGNPDLESGFSFQPIFSKDSLLLQTAFDLQRSNVVAVDRIDRTGFLYSLQAHYMQPWAILDRSGKMVGYLTASEDHLTINEQAACADVPLMHLLFAWITNWHLSGITFWLMPWDYRYLHEMNSCWENMLLESPSMFLVRNWPQLIQSFLGLKLQSADLPEGRIVLHIETGENLAISVQDGQAACTFTDQPADLAVDRLTATRLIFGPLPPQAVLAVRREISRCVQAWFPLPLSWYPQDNV